MAAPPGRHADGNGLYLYVQPTGTRSWVQCLVIRGRRRELGLGSARLVSLAEAREQALANRKLARSGGDPLAERRRAQGIPTFAEAARAVVEQKRASWRDSTHAKTWLSSLERFAFPRVGGRPVSEVNSADVIEILTPIWYVKMQTARKVRHRIRAVLEWAIAMIYRTDNPCDRVAAVLGPQQFVVEHMQALPHQQVAAAVATVRASGANPAVKLAFEFLVLTAVRSGEVPGATWDEMDTKARVWTIPASRMKAKRDHRVPLCRRATEVLDGRGRSATAPVRSCSPPERGSRSATIGCAGCSTSTVSRPCRTGSVRRSGTGPRSGRTIRGRSSRQRWRTWSRIRSRWPMRGRTYSSADDG